MMVNYDGEWMVNGLVVDIIVVDMVFNINL